MFIVSLLFAETIDIDQNEFQVNVLNSNESYTVIDYRFGNFETEPVRINGETFHKIRLENESTTFEKGNPELPKITRSIIIPDRAKMEVEIVESEHVEYKLKIPPSKGLLSREIDPESVSYQFADMYSQNEFYPENLSETGKPYILRDLRGMTITVFPFSYNAQTEILRVYHHLTIKVDNIGLDDVNVKTRETTGHNSYFTSLYRNHFLNYDDILSREIEENGRMLVICYNDYLEAANPYVNWKNQKGIQTDIYNISDIGADTTSIKNFIQTEYDADNSLTFVQFIGDEEHIPSCMIEREYCPGQGSSDPSYALLEGNDSYPDIFIGRFSAQTIPDVETQVSRSIYYERDIIDGDWLQKGTGLGSVWGEGYGYLGLSDRDFIELLRGNLLDYNYNSIDQLYESGDVPYINPVPIEYLVNAVNEGRGIINAAGSGDCNSSFLIPPGDPYTQQFTANDVYSLTNDNMLPFIFLTAPYLGNFQFPLTYPEAWLRATNPITEAAIGGIAVYASSVDLDYASPEAAQFKMVELLVNEEYSTIGGLYYNGSCYSIDIYGARGEKTLKSFNIFGDVSLQVRTDIPEVMTIEHAETIEPDQTVFDVSTGVQDALVCLSFDNEIIAAEHTDEAGNVSLDIEGMVSNLQLLTLTITAYNKITSIEYILVISTYAEDTPEVNPEVMELIGNYPNPFYSSTIISFSLTAEDKENAEISIYNIKGQKIRSFQNLQINKSSNRQIVWDGKDENGKAVRPGLYFYKLSSGPSFSQTKKMILMR